MLDGYYIKKVGQNRGKPRVWLDAQVAKAGMEPGQRYDVVVNGQTVVLQANPDGSRIVSGKRSKDGEKINPLIDLNSQELLAIFDGMTAVRVAVKQGEIYILPLASELKKRERMTRLKHKLEAGEALTIGSLSHGGGVMTHALHQGLEAAGHTTKLAFANEIREELLEHAAIHNDAWSTDTKVFAAPMQELAFDERGIANIPKTEILEAGIPCSGASKSGRAKRGLAHAESHPEVGHLVVAALVILSKANPAVAIIENVVPYASSASAEILRNQFRDMGYVTHERVLNGVEWGTFENRDRWFMVAVTEGIEFDIDQLLPPQAVPRELKEILDPVALDDPQWRTMEALKAKEVRDLAAGKNFKMQTFAQDATSVGTITKGYAKVRSTDPKVRHPEDPDLLRQFSVAEHARIKGVPENLVSGLSATIGHEVLGQGVIHNNVKDLGHHIGNALNRLVGKDEIPLAGRVQVSVVQVENADASKSMADIAAEVVGKLDRADIHRGSYSGRIVAADGDLFIQDVGRNEGVLHSVEQLDQRPRLGQVVNVQYRSGTAKVTPQEKDKQLSLQL
ncbi:DNA cytosine methyltransferase [Burkholderia cenocepacia]|uniref:DNA cytosine methyltransferase n=1 Tax=Burkholderia cenocepacia TaxID=95486 RepID=UPI0013DFBF8A|nr:DNA cytosine methyltransferase [Burkholderia cenocepacia]MCW3589059.1 DNA cytosine methyltransferase [Burkholderia cenocepacia]MCW3632529.1 DNA cytosine methyltransferase [Burkholderia cenocepacia]MCW5181759.1 DNA cytosine methyltransferase [Burkholderia cenocepacia]NGO93328.1 DNA cytosine methyltransferase [Burkholderia cenocepacia]